MRYEVITGAKDFDGENIILETDDIYEAASAAIKNDGEIADNEREAIITPLQVMESDGIISEYMQQNCEITVLNSLEGHDVEFEGEMGSLVILPDGRAIELNKEGAEKWQGE